MSTAHHEHMCGDTVSAVQYDDYWLYTILSACVLVRIVPFCLMGPFERFDYFDILQLEDKLIVNAFAGQVCTYV